jgi:hypothetical protein
MAVGGHQERGGRVRPDAIEGEELLGVPASSYR